MESWLFWLPPYWLFPPVLIVLCAVAGRLKHPCMRATATTLLGNWAVCSVAVIACHNSYPVEALAAADVLSGVIVLLLIPLGHHRLTRWQRGIGLIYAFQCVVHAGVAWTDTEQAVYYGYFLIGWAAWAQALVVAAWGAYLHRHRVSDRRPSARHMVASHRSRGTSRAPRT